MTRSLDPALMYASLDTEGRATAFFAPDIHAPGQIPEDAVAISPEIWAQWIGDTAGQRWTGSMLEPYAAPVTAADLIAYANAKQWALAVGGFAVTIKGAVVPFATDETALGLMDGKVMRLAQPNPPASVNWQTGPTTFASIAADDFVHAATLVSDFVQATFDALPPVFAGVAAGAITATAQIDAAAWPARSGAIA